MTEEEKAKKPKEDGSWQTQITELLKEIKGMLQPKGADQGKISESITQKVQQIPVPKPQEEKTKEEKTKEVKTSRLKNFWEYL